MAAEDAEPLQPSSTTSSSGRVPVTCQVCSAGTAKYTCPGCGVRSCSLGCVQQHKAANGCSGKRDRLGYVPLADYSEKQLLSDYRLLEEVARAEDVARRRRPPPPQREQPPPLATLVSQARCRGVNLLLMSPGMQRRISNTTRFDFNSQRMRWRCEWRFLVEAEAAAVAAAAEATAAAEAGGSDGAAAASAPEPPDAATTTSASSSAGGSPAGSWVSVVDPQVDEGGVLAALLKAHLAYRPGGGARAALLREYSAVAPEQLVVLLRKEQCPANAPRWYRLDTAASLGAALMGKTVLEHPSLLVVLPRHLEGGGFTLVAQEEAQAEAAAAQQQASLQQRQPLEGGHHPRQQGGRGGGRGGRGRGRGRGAAPGGWLAGSSTQHAGAPPPAEGAAQEVEQQGAPADKRVRFSIPLPAPPPGLPPGATPAAAGGPTACSNRQHKQDEEDAALLAGLEAADVQLGAGAADVMALLGQYDDNEIDLQE